MSSLEKEIIADIAQSDPPQVIAVASGKGGVGKTTISINLATALANRGHHVMLLDGDAGMADVEVALGLHPLYDLSDVLRGDQKLADIVLDGPSGVSIVPAASGSRGVTEQEAVAGGAVISAFDQLDSAPQILIIDTAAGIVDSVMRFAQAACEVLVVIGPEPTSLSNAYSLIRALHESADVCRFRVLVNRVNDETQARDLFVRLARDLDSDLSIALNYIGNIPDDSATSRALMQQRPVVNLAPRSDIAQAFKQLARRIENWTPPAFNNGGMSFFMHRQTNNQNPNRTYVKEVA